MASKSKSKQEEALQFLDDLDSLNPVADPAATQPGIAAPIPPTNPSSEGEAEALAFIDEVTRKSTDAAPRPLLDRPISRSGTPTLRKSTDRLRVGGGPSATAPSSKLDQSNTPPRTTEKAGESSVPAGGSWGWGSVWSSASAAIQQAKQVVDEQVKQLPKNEQARKWGEGVLEYAKAAQLDKLGQDFKRVGLSTLTDILNVVAPPISEHEVIQVWLSHDMQGYEGIESLVYKAMARILEQVEGGDLVVNRGEESRPKDTGKEARELNAVDGYDAAFKLAQAELDQLIKNNAAKPSAQAAIQTPTTYSNVYIRVQPFLSELHDREASKESGEASEERPKNSILQFVLLLSDPEHNLSQVSVTQAIPSHWLQIWDQYSWVEDLVAESLRVGVELLGQEYLVARMGWASSKEETAAEVKQVQEDSDADMVVVDSKAT